MDRIEEQKKIEERYKESMATLEHTTGFEERVDFVDGNRIFLKKNDFDNNSKTVHAFREKFGKYKVNHYYMSCGLLAIDYVFNDFALISFNTDSENALEKVSNGKCRIDIKATQDKCVVCDLD